MSSIIKVSGPTVQASKMSDSFMYEVVRVGNEQLLGEIILMRGDVATIQVYEDTGGLKIGDPVKPLGELMSVELGPGLIGSIYDGIQRPLPVLALEWGDFIQKGATVHRLDPKRKWRFTPLVKDGDVVQTGTILGTVQETKRIAHKIMVPEKVSGKIKKIFSGELTIRDTVAILESGEKIKLAQKSNIREPRKTCGKLPHQVPMLTGQRVLDTLFPIAEGGTAIIPGGFGTGKTVLEQTIAKFADADVIVYVGCGERGNEMADVLHEFPELKDPRYGSSLMERTILIANTSNMPVAAREASIYTAISIAEYYRDMGYRVAVMADSTSRWAEALREISSRLEEMPGEEGYPPYLASRLGSFYERSGRVRCSGRPLDIGSITIIGAVSPPGGDFSEPVTQASMRMASTYWALDYDLAHQRHFPAINWLNSFSLSLSSLSSWYIENLDEHWVEMVADMNLILQRETELLEMVKIVGLDAMGESERIELEAGMIIREGFLRQSSYHETDAYCSMEKQRKLLSLQLFYVSSLRDALQNGLQLEEILDTPVKESVIRLKEVRDSEIDSGVEQIEAELKAYFRKRLGK